MEIPGGTTKSKEQRRFFYRNGKECLAHLFKNPMFDGNMELHAYTKYSNAADLDNKEQIVDNPMSGVYFNTVQVRFSFCQITMLI